MRKLRWHETRTDGKRRCATQKMEVPSMRLVLAIEKQRVLLSLTTLKYSKLIQQLSLGLESVNQQDYKIHFQIRTVSAESIVRFFIFLFLNVTMNFPKLAIASPLASSSQGNFVSGVALTATRQSSVTPTQGTSGGGVWFRCSRWL